MMLYICTTFHENISKGFRVIELTISIQKCTNEHNSIKQVSGVKVLVLCTLCDDALYCIKFRENISNGF